MSTPATTSERKPGDFDMAMRHPKRGKSHLYRMSSQAWCGAEAGPMSEIVPIAQTAPEDRCKRCFSDPKRYKE